MQREPVRIRVRFAKTEHMRYTGHLDLHHTWERTFRRASLPLVYSQGFNPRPKLHLASALPLGFTSEAEVLDAWLEEEVPLHELSIALREAAPPGIQIQEVASVPLRAPTLQTLVDAADFEITFLEPVPDLVRQVENLLTAESLPRRRRGKDYDLRPLILDAQILDRDEEGRQRLWVRLAAREGATGRPEEVVTATGEVPEHVRVHRIGLIFSQ